ncbi:MAG: hypothetical protein ABI769_18420 [Pseudomonadota bacterium]
MHVGSMMEKLTYILAVIDSPENGEVVLDKAVALARRFGARVELMVPEFVPMRPFAKRCTDLGYDQVMLSSVARGPVPLHEIIIKRVLAVKPDLVVKAGVAGQAPHSSVTTGDWQLAHECPVPILLVRQTPWAVPPRFATSIGVDDEDAERLARSILHTAGFLALGCRGNLDILYSEREEHDERLRMERAVKVAQLVREFHVGCERIQMFSGPPEDRLPALTAVRQYDVLVLGVKSAEAHHHSLKDHFVSRMIERAESDLVLVRAVSCASRQAGESAPSFLKQGLDQVEELV